MKNRRFEWGLRAVQLVVLLSLGGCQTEPIKETMPAETIQEIKNIVKPMLSKAEPIAPEDRIFLGDECIPSQQIIVKGNSGNRQIFRKTMEEKLARIIEEQGGDISIVQLSTDRTKMLIRTYWRDGLKDLILLKDEVAADTPSSLKMDLSTKRGRRGIEPKMEVYSQSGINSCRYQSSDAVIRGSNENATRFESMPAFLAESLLDLSGTPGCGLTSQSKDVKIRIRNSLLSPSASFPEKMVLLVSDTAGQTRSFTAQELNEGEVGVKIFNRPGTIDYLVYTNDRAEIETDLGFAREENDQEWLDRWLVGSRKVSNEDVCNIHQKGSGELNFTLLADHLDDASLALSINQEHPWLQQNPGLHLGARWHLWSEDIEEERVVSEFSLARWDEIDLCKDEICQEMMVDDESLKIVQLVGGNKLLPGRYRVELQWLETEEQLKVGLTPKQRSFWWYSHLPEENYTDYYGLLGPNGEEIGDSPNTSEMITKLFDSYYLQQPLTGRVIHWEEEGSEVSMRVAGAILSYYDEHRELPYVPYGKGEQGVAEELLRALNVLLQPINAENPLKGRAEGQVETALDTLNEYEPEEPEAMNSDKIWPIRCQLAFKLEEEDLGMVPMWMKQQCE